MSPMLLNRSLLIVPVAVLAVWIALPTQAENKAPADAATKDSKTALMQLDVSMNRPAADRGYRRPYVAVWISDADGFPVRTLALWVQKPQPGPRWIPDLKQWYKADRMRQLVDDTNLVDGISSATRTSGDYKLNWDGLDDHQQPLAAGNYTLNIEAAREHGTYQLMRSPLVHGAEPFEKSLDGNVEIKGATISYRGLAK